MELLGAVSSSSEHVPESPTPFGAVSRKPQTVWSIFLGAVAAPPGGASGAAKPEAPPGVVQVGGSSPPMRSGTCSNHFGAFRKLLQP
eukprot:950145-Alexandrium_andersonii.AAC.1